MHFFVYRNLCLSSLFQTTWFRLCSLKGVKSFKLFHLAMWKFYLFTEVTFVQKYFLQEKYCIVIYSNSMHPSEDLNSYNPCRFLWLYLCEKILYYIWKECISFVEVYIYALLLLYTLLCHVKFNIAYLLILNLWGNVLPPSLERCISTLIYACCYS